MSKKMWDVGVFLLGIMLGYACMTLLFGCSTPAPAPAAPVAPAPELPTITPAPEPYCVPAALLTVDRPCAAVCISDGWAFGKCEDPKPCAIIRDGGAVQVLVIDETAVAPDAPPPTITGRECPAELDI